MEQECIIGPITLYISGGLLFICILMIIFIKTLTKPQFWLIRLLAALGAAGIGSVIPGLLEIESTTQYITIKAAGAIGLFILTYLVNPPEIVRNQIL